MSHESRAGESWFLSGNHFSMYNHCQTPNASARDCTVYPWAGDIQNRTLREDTFTARSNHNGGVNVMMMDGSVRFVSDWVDLRIWRAAATRAGGETIGPTGHF